MTKLETLFSDLKEHFRCVELEEDTRCEGSLIGSFMLERGEITLEVQKEALTSVCKILRDEPNFLFEQMIDLCGVDYLHYGLSEWQTSEVSNTGFSRARKPKLEATWPKARFAVVYHLLSVSHNHRVRLKVFLEESKPMVDSVVDIWASANWFEREAFDLFGLLFEGHPDLRRILTDYDFIGHPFRKDFPLMGHVEVRYDAKEERVIYEPIKEKASVSTPKTIRCEGEPLAKERLDVERKEQACMGMEALANDQRKTQKEVGENVRVVKKDG